MKFWVGITVDNWFVQLSRLKPDEANFWQPGSTPPRRMDPGTLFLFKLHAPDNYIVGAAILSGLLCFLVFSHGRRSVRKTALHHYRN